MMIFAKLSLTFFIFVNWLAMTQAATNITQLRSLITSNPTPVGYWPLSSQYWLRDGSGNNIDGVFKTTNGTSITGPFGVANTAFQTGTTSPIAYLSFTNSLLNVSSGSFTLATYLNMNSISQGPIFEWFNSATSIANLWENDGVGSSNANKLYFDPNGTNPVIASLNCSILNTWQFVGIVYNRSASTFQLFCNSTLGPVNNLSQAPKTSATLNAGYSKFFSPYEIPIQLTCISLFSTALTSQQLISVSQMCPLFQAVTCSQCVADSCRPSFTAPNAYTCSSCLSGWTSVDCSIAICSPSCVHGNCSAPNVCSCQAGWTGSTCATPVCSPACSNGGTCSAPNSCLCPTGWTGPSCTAPICSPSCSINGNCTAPNTCTCLSGWIGSNCAVPTCSIPCPSGGSCVAPNVCLAK